LQGWGLGGFVDPAIAPLFWIMSGAVIFCVAYCGRSLTRNVDVSWQKEQTPQNALNGKQFKFFNPRSTEFANFKVPEY